MSGKQVSDDVSSKASFLLANTLVVYYLVDKLVDSTYD